MRIAGSRLLLDAMTSPVDSAPYFVQRAEEISLARRVSDALKAKGVTTLAQLAFCVGQPGQVLAQADFDAWSESISKATHPGSADDAGCIVEGYG